MSQIAVGIDIGTSTINTVVAERAKQQRILRLLGVGRAVAQGMRRGAVTDAGRARERIRASVRNAERASGLKIHHAYLGVGGIYLSSLRAKGSIMVSRPDGEITEYDVERAILAAREHVTQNNRKMFHTIPVSYNIDQDITLRSPIGMRGAKLESDVLFVSSLQGHLNGLIRATEDAGVAIDGLIAAPIAASRVLLSTQQREVGAALLDIGAETTTIGVFEEGSAISVAAFPIGSVHITHDIALGLQIPLHEAEKLKCAYGADAGMKKKIGTIVEARLGDVFELVERHLKKTGRNGLLPGGVICTGGGAHIPGVIDLARQSLRLPAEQGRVRHFQQNADIEDPRLSSALGLCAMGLLDDENGTTGFAATRNIGNAILRWLRSLAP